MTNPQETQEPVDVTSLAPAMQPVEPVELEPISYSHMTTDELCAEWLTISPDDLRREERMDEIARCLAGKVDAMDNIHADSLANAEGYEAAAASYYERYVKPLEAKAKTERRRAAGIESLLLYIMKKNDLAEIPGERAKAVLKVYTSNPASTWQRDPTAADMAKFGENFVRFVPHRYEWESKAVKAAVMGGELKDFDALKLTPKETVQFKPVVDVKSIPPKRKKGKPK